MSQSPEKKLYSKQSGLYRFSSGKLTMVVSFTLPYMFSFKLTHSTDIRLELILLLCVSSCIPPSNMVTKRKSWAVRDSSFNSAINSYLKHAYRFKGLTPYKASRWFHPQWFKLQTLSLSLCLHLWNKDTGFLELEEGMLWKLTPSRYFETLNHLVLILKQHCSVRNCP